jgi:phage-related protein
MSTTIGSLPAAASAYPSLPGASAAPREEAPAATAEAGETYSFSTESLQRLAENAIDGLGDAWDSATSTLGEAADGVGGLARDAYQAVEDTVSSSASYVSDAVSSAEDSVRSTASDIGDAVSSAASNINSAMGGVGGYLSLAIALAK